MKLTDFEALSFDCYGTLIDWEAGLAAVLTPWAREHRLTVSTGELLERYADAEARHEEETPGALYPEILAAAMRSLGAAFGVDVEPGGEPASGHLGCGLAGIPRLPGRTCRPLTTLQARHPFQR